MQRSLLNIAYPDPAYLDIRAYRVESIVADLAPALKACADDPKKYFVAKDGSEITNAFKKMGELVTSDSKLRLTQ